jgi:hypothetical protein
VDPKGKQTQLLLRPEPLNDLEHPIVERRRITPPECEGYKLASSPSILTIFRVEMIVRSPPIDACEGLDDESPG